MDVRKQDIRDAAEDVMRISAAMKEALRRRGNSGLAPDDIELLASAAELVQDKASMISGIAADDSCDNY